MKMIGKIHGFFFLAAEGESKCRIVNEVDDFVMVALHSGRSVDVQHVFCGTFFNGIAFFLQLLYEKHLGFNPFIFMTVEFSNFYHGVLRPSGFPQPAAQQGHQNAADYIPRYVDT